MGKKLKIKKISNVAVHKMPADLKGALHSSSQALMAWESLTSLAQNEWICWVTFVKKDRTRKDHVKRTVEELIQGMRRPCCWLGCIHRTDKQLSPSQKFVLNNRPKKGSLTKGIHEQRG